MPLSLVDEDKMADNEISFDAESQITELEDFIYHFFKTGLKERSQNDNSKQTRSVVVKIPLEQVSTQSSTGSLFASKKKKELLKKSKETESNTSRSQQI